MNKEKTDFHGGNIYKIFREKNIDKILDYSSNINPYGLPENLKNYLFWKDIQTQIISNLEKK